MKTLDELLLALRDETITALELKDLERLLADKDGRERLFEESLMTATISEALKAAPAPSAGGETPPPQKRLWTPFLLLAGSLLLLAVAAYYFQRTLQTDPHQQESVPLPVVEEKKPEQRFEAARIPLPLALKGFSGTIAGKVTRVGREFIVVKLTMTQPDLYNQEVVIITKPVANAPLLSADDRIYAVIKEADDRLVASAITKINPKIPKQSSDF